MVHIGTQGVQRSLRIAPRLGRQHFNTLGQQHSGFALYLHLVLQVFNAAHALGQLGFERSEWLFAQGRAGLGSVTLPGQSIGNVQFGGVNQGLSPGGPLGSQQLLPFGALGFVQTLAHQLGRALVLNAELAEHIGQQISAGVALQPLPNARGPVACSCGGECAAGQAVQLGNVEVFGRVGRGHSG